MGNGIPLAIKFLAIHSKSLVILGLSLRIASNVDVCKLCKLNVAPLLLKSNFSNISAIRKTRSLLFFAYVIAVVCSLGLGCLSFALTRYFAISKSLCKIPKLASEALFQDIAYIPIYFILGHVSY